MNLVPSGLRAALSAALGPRSANREIQWMLSYLNENTSTNQDEQSAKLTSMVHRRLEGEPLQYILGTQPFGPLDLLVRPPVLIPRPETEDWTLRLAKLIQPSPLKPIRLLDLCAGSGCIPLLLCHLWRPGAVRALAVDFAEEAVLLTGDNANRVGVPLQDTKDCRLGNSRNSITLLQTDILQTDKFFQTLKHLQWSPFDILTSNPPYIPKSQYDTLPTSVRNYEDPRALLGDPPGSPSGDGLTFYRAIAQLCASGLVKEGAPIALEVGDGQSRQVEDLMISQGKVQKTEIWRDPWDKERVVLAWK